MNEICRYNQTGYCKHGRHCQKRHINEICPEGRECKVSCCVRRHPKICKYFDKKNKCRFDECSYAHEKDAKTVKIEFLENKIIELKADLIILEKNFHNKTKILSDEVAQLNRSFVKISNKFEEIEHDKRNNINKVTKSRLSKKDRVIEIESCQSVSKNKDKTTSFSQQLNYKCQHCEYENDNKVTFEKHINTKHADKYENIIECSEECPLCSDEFSTIKELNDHKAEHLNEIENMNIELLLNGHDLFECNLCSFESGHEDSVKEHMIEHVNFSPKKKATNNSEETVNQSDKVVLENHNDNSSSLESGYGDSLKEHSTQHVMPQKENEKETYPEITKKTESELLLEEYDSDGSFIGNDSMNETEESAESDDKEE